MWINIKKIKKAKNETAKSKRTNRGDKGINKRAVYFEISKGATCASSEFQGPAKI